MLEEGKLLVKVDGDIAVEEGMDRARQDISEQLV